MNVLTLDNIDVNGKAVLLRVDINSPFDGKIVSDNDRIKEHCETIKYLASQDAKLVIIAHQGRKGDPDFTNLEQHAKLIENHVGKHVEFVPDITGPLALEKIKSLQPGEIILLDNLRGLDEETAKVSIEQHAQSNLVKTLAPLFDYFVQDGFSVCHRAQASVVGFSYVIKAVAGKVLEKELSALEKIESDRAATYILGGAKPEENIIVLKHALKNPNNIILTGGVFGLICLAADGVELGKNDEKLDAKIIEEMRTLINSTQMVLNSDFVEDGGSTITVEELPSEKLLLDIGNRTVSTYVDIINDSNVIFAKGPMGKFEDEKYMNGTREILEAVANSEAFSLIGGGNTTDAIARLNIPKEKFSHVSLSGGALLEFIAGEKLPGIEALKKWKE